MVFLLLLAGWLAPLSTRADNGNDVVVLYNSCLPASKAVAEHYAAARQVPAGHLFGFALTTNEVMTRADFRDFLQAQLAADLVETKLWKFGNVTLPASAHEPKRTEKRVVESKIRYAVLCWGMPLKIAADETLKDSGSRSNNVGFGRNEAAVDSELAWLPLFKTKVPLNGPLLNPFYACTNQALFSPTNGLLLVARLDGPTPEIANALVDKAMAADCCLPSRRRMAAGRG
jgi:uncharacterized protein (TIGR03790 family)